MHAHAAHSQPLTGRHGGDEEAPLSKHAAVLEIMSSHTSGLMPGGYADVRIGIPGQKYWHGLVTLAGGNIHPFWRKSGRNSSTFW